MQLVYNIYCNRKYRDKGLESIPVCCIAELGETHFSFFTLLPPSFYNLLLPLFIICIICSHNEAKVACHHNGRSRNFGTSWASHSFGPICDILENGKCLTDLRISKCKPLHLHKVCQHELNEISCRLWINASPFDYCRLRHSSQDAILFLYPLCLDWQRSL